MLTEQEWSKKRDYYISALRALDVPKSADAVAMTKFNHDFNCIYAIALTDEAYFKSEYENINLKRKMNYAEAYLTVSSIPEDSYIDDNGKKVTIKNTIAILEAKANMFINNEEVEEYGMSIIKAWEIANKRSAFMSAVVTAMKDKRDAMGVLQSILKAERNS